MAAEGCPESLVSLFLGRLAEDGRREALYMRREGGYQPLTWEEIARDVRRAAAALVRLGIEPGDRVVQVSENRYEWIVADLAILMARAVHVPVHATLTGPQIAYAIADCGAKLVLVSGEAQAAKLVGLGEQGQTSALAATLGPRGYAVPRLVSFDPCPGIDWGGEPIGQLAESINRVTDEEARQIEALALESLRPETLATILYTSGTTGEPKGVMLSHGNLVFNASSTLSAFAVDPSDLRLAWLPLSHIFARTCDLYLWMACGCGMALAESRETIIANCAEIQPTLLNGVPYFFDKVQRYLVDHGLADVPDSLRMLLGGRVRFCCSGGAALPVHVARFFEEHGVLLVEGYGLTESSPVITVNTERAYKHGTVGRPIPGVEVRLADDGEVLTRGPHVMLGYWNRPADTAEAIRDGWLYTGDLGQIDAEGYLRITGRKKELIVTAAGKNIAPVYLEALLTEDPLIAQAMVIGDGRNYLTALVVPEAEQLHKELAEQGIAAGGEPLRDPAVRKLYSERIRKRLAAVSPAEQVRNFVLLEQPFTIESGELTPTLKLRRSLIAEHYHQAIEAMYAGRPAIPGREPEAG